VLTSHAGAYFTLETRCQIFMSVIIEGAGAVRQSIYHYTIDMAWVCILFRFYFCEIYIFQGSTKASLGPSYVN